jgi:hypothetical protein
VVFYDICFLSFSFFSIHFFLQLLGDSKGHALWKNHTSNAEALGALASCLDLLATFQQALKPINTKVDSSGQSEELCFSTSILGTLCSYRFVHIKILAF